MNPSPTTVNSPISIIWPTHLSPSLVNSPISIIEQNIVELHCSVQEQSRVCSQHSMEGHSCRNINLNMNQGSLYILCMVKNQISTVGKNSKKCKLFSTKDSSQSTSTHAWKSYFSFPAVYLSVCLSVCLCTKLSVSQPLPPFLSPCLCVSLCESLCVSQALPLFCSPSLNLPLLWLAVLMVSSSDFNSLILPLHSSLCSWMVLLRTSISWKYSLSLTTLQLSPAQTGRIMASRRKTLLQGDMFQITSTWNWVLAKCHGTMSHTDSAPVPKTNVLFCRFSGFPLFAWIYVVPHTTKPKSVYQEPWKCQTI